MIPAEETFEGTFPFEPHFTEAAGFSMHYVDEGDGEPIICLHGQPTWGYIYRRFIPPLSKTHRVIVPDHMGFGKSETPQDRQYTLRTHVANLTALIEELDLSDITFIGQDWGGPIAAGYAVRHPDHVKRFCLMNTMLGYGRTVVDPSAHGSVKPPSLWSSPWFRWVARSLEDGSYYEILGNLGQNIGALMQRLGMSTSILEDKLRLRAYGAPFPSREQCKGAIEFPLDVAHSRITDFVREGASGVEVIRAKSAMLAEGMEDQAMPPQLVIWDFKALFPEGPVVELEGVGHYCQEDAPQTLVALVQQFIQMR
jgi:haloalkane dehalogenase